MIPKIKYPFTEIETIILLLTTVFVSLKLTNYINWSWIWVLSPIWISISVTLIIVLILYILCRKYKP